MDVFEEVQFDKTAWAEQKKAQRQAAYEMVDNCLDSMPMEESKLRQYLTVQGRFPQCSVGNAVLIAAQRPEATEYHTFDDWKKQDVSINKGEQSFTMLVPNGTYKGDDGKTHTSFDVQKVFDISQTNAAPKQTEQDLRLTLKAMLMRPVCPVQVVNHQQGAVFVVTENKVEIGRGMSMEDTMRNLSMALAHGELAKVIPNYNPGEPQNSFYARCASYVICTHYGADARNYSFSDMQSALGPCNSNEVRQHLQVIREAAKTLIERTDKARTAILARAKTMQAQNREQEQEAR